VLVMAATDAPLTEAELDLLAALDAARTPGPLVLRTDRNEQWNIYASDNDDEWIALLPHQCVRSIAEQRGHDARAIAAALNALPALLAEVRASRAAPAPYLIDALEAYGRAFCRAAHLDTQARRTALADAERAVLRCVEGASTTAEPDTAQRLHIPRDLLTRPEGVR
jgi:hypothetical protein